MGILTVLWEKWVEFRRDFYKITLAAMIAPLLYILVFGLGMSSGVQIGDITISGLFIAVVAGAAANKILPKEMDENSDTEQEPLEQKEK